MSLRSLFALTSFLCLTVAQATNVSSFVPENWSIVEAKSPDLDGDGRRDRLLVLQKHDVQGTQSLLLLKGVDGGFRMMARSPDGLLSCIECGIYRRLEAGRGWFRIVQGSEGDWRWTDTHTFKLQGGRWMLTSLTRQTVGSGFKRTFQVPPNECASSELDSFSCGSGNDVWQKIVTSERAYFYPARRPVERTEKFVIAGQRVEILDEPSGFTPEFINVRYTSPAGKVTEGYMRKSDLSYPR